MNDLESHAVLIVGYDDTKEAVALIDPWNKAWGGSHGGRWWMPYSMLSITNVDSSMGVAMCLSPLEIKPEFCWDASDNLSIKLEVGFYTPRGTVMDRESWKLTELNVHCTLPECWGGGYISRNLQGKWLVGDIINLTLPIANSPKQDGEIKLHLLAKISGKRPYDFTDELEVYDNLFIQSPNSVLNNSEENLSRNLALQSSAAF